MRRRDFIRVVGSAVAWPLAVRAQSTAVPTIGFIGGESPEPYAERLRAFHQGLKDKLGCQKSNSKQRVQVLLEKDLHRLFDGVSRASKLIYLAGTDTK